MRTFSCLPPLQEFFPHETRPSADVFPGGIPFGQRPGVHPVEYLPGLAHAFYLSNCQHQPIIVLFQHKFRIIFDTYFSIPMNSALL